VQDIEFRAPLKTSPELRKATAVVRAAISPLGDDRHMANDLGAASDLVASGALAASIADDILPTLAA